MNASVFGNERDILIASGAHMQPTLGGLPDKTVKVPWAWGHKLRKFCSWSPPILIQQASLAAVSLDMMLLDCCIAAAAFFCCWAWECACDRVCWSPFGLAMPSADALPRAILPVMNRPPYKEAHTKLPGSLPSAIGVGHASVILRF